MAIQMERREESSGRRKGASAATAAPPPEPPSTATATSAGERRAAAAAAAEEEEEEATSQTIATDAFPDAAAKTGIAASLLPAAGCDICREKRQHSEAGAGGGEEGGGAPAKGAGARAEAGAGGGAGAGGEGADHGFQTRPIKTRMICPHAWPWCGRQWARRSPTHPVPAGRGTNTKKRKQTGGRNNGKTRARAHTCRSHTRSRLRPRDHRPCGRPRIAIPIAGSGE